MKKFFWVRMVFFFYVGIVGLVFIWDIFLICFEVVSFFNVKYLCCNFRGGKNRLSLRECYEYVDFGYKGVIWGGVW